jgi:hypothetical protein
MLVFREGALDVTTQEMSLSNASVTDKNNLEQKVVVFVVTRIHF